MGATITVRNVYKTYRSAGETIKALNNVSLTVNEGEIFGLLGPNGAGKTSLISILAGILSPDKGSAEVLCINCTGESRTVQQLLNVVSGFTGAPSSLSVDEALMYYCLLYNVKNPKKKINELLKLTNLEGARRMEAEDLSSGMKQRYLIAKALLNDPKVLILDEPTVGLDVESAISIREMVKRLRSEGRTVMLTTHNMFEAEELCDRIAFINHGRILDTGTVEQLKERIIGERAIEVNCSDAKEVAGRLGEIKGVSAHVVSGRLVHVTVDSYRRMKNIMKALSGVKSDVFNVTALEPSLEETYLRIINNRGAKDG